MRNKDTNDFRFMVPCIVFQYVNVPNLMSLYIDLFYQLSISTCFGHSLPIFRSEIPAYLAVGITNICWIVRCVVQ
jgi:hypothetical protein